MNFIKKITEKRRNFGKYLPKVNNKSKNNHQVEILGPHYLPKEIIKKLIELKEDIEKNNPQMYLDILIISKEGKFQSYHTSNSYLSIKNEKKIELIESMLKSELISKGDVKFKINISPMNIQRNYNINYKVNSNLTFLSKLTEIKYFN